MITSDADLSAVGMMDGSGDVTMEKGREAKLQILFAPIGVERGRTPERQEIKHSRGKI